VLSFGVVVFDELFVCGSESLVVDGVCSDGKISADSCGNNHLREIGWSFLREDMSCILRVTDARYDEPTAVL